MDKVFAIKGNIIYCTEPTEFIVRDGAYLVCDGGRVAGVFMSLPEKYKDAPVTDFGDKLIIPGMSDLHTHASQFALRGTDMDLELLDWLNKHAFPEEARYADERFADRAYDLFVSELLHSTTTRAAIFATVHGRASLQLMEKLEKSGLRCYVGKVNMDRNCPDYLKEDTQRSVHDTELFAATAAQLSHTKPIITPRFTPSCSDELMEGLGEVAKKHSLPVQSHLSESISEINWVRALAPDARDYADTYERFGLLGDTPTIMAHCVYCMDSELERMKRKGVYIAHCPQSNANLCAGVSPVRRYLNDGMKVGLGSDVASGSSLSLLRAVADAVQASKLRYRLFDNSLVPVNFTEAFYMATVGGGSFFGKVGSFMPGYDFDAVVLDDSDIHRFAQKQTTERLEQLAYFGSEKVTCAKYVAGERVYSRGE